MTGTWVVVLPAVFAIIVSLWSKRIFWGLFSGIFVGHVILAGGNPLTGLTASLEELIKVLASNWNMKIILFATLMGGLVALLNASGGVRGTDSLAGTQGLGQKQKRGPGLCLDPGSSALFRSGYFRGHYRDRGTGPGRQL